MVYSTLHHMLQPVLKTLIYQLKFSTSHIKYGIKKWHPDKKCSPNATLLFIIHNIKNNMKITI